MFRRFIFALSLLTLLVLLPSSTSAQAPNPWDTPVGQACFEQWIALAMSRMNSYKGPQDFEDNKPFSINKYGVLEYRYRHSAYAPDNFGDYNYNKYWYMWDWWGPTGWDCVDKYGNWASGGQAVGGGVCPYFGESKANVPKLRDYIPQCIAQSGGGGTGTGGAGGSGGGGGGGGGGTTNFPPVPDKYGCTTAGTTINAIDGDAENQLDWCDNRVPFGDESSDKGRCFSFRYQVPPGGVKSALLRIQIKPLGGLDDTDNVIAAVGSPQNDCRADKMPGCVLIHGGFTGHAEGVEIDLLNNGCDRDIQVNENAVQPLASQLNTGVLHVRLQDDTAVLGAQLLLNCSPTCKTPPTGGEPNTNVSRMTLQAAKRSVIEGQTALIPVWLVKANNVANINYELTYNGAVAKIEGNPSKGNLLDNALFSANAKDSGILRAGLAQTSGLSGTGTVTNIPFRAVGKPGDRTTLELKVTTVNDPNGGVPQIDRINGEIVILNQDGTLPGGGGGGSGEIPRGDCDGDRKLTESDALCALEMSVQLRPALAIMDMDGNGAIDSRDAVIILQRVMSGG